MQYLTLLSAIILEVCGTLLLPYTQQFTKLFPTIGMIICYALSFYFLTIVLKYLPLAVVYATWSGLGVFGIALFSYLILNQSLSWQVVVGLVLIVKGVILVNIYTN
ncbi:MAG: multidrug efflux SMR transporter [Pseudomonadota bacterium]|nr:multidrug efflux SMR transporter [Pseudomonadota bacterium]|tara:strand:- start:4206 stop:4523 length:318 start_codon:yes stop_codon:yes gene_type:complete